MYFKLIIITLLPLSICKLQTLPDEITPRISLSYCIVFGCQRYFNGSSNILLVSLPLSEVNPLKPSSIRLDNLLLYDVFNLYKFSVFINKADHKIQQYVAVSKAESYIIQIRNKYDVDGTLSKLKLHDTWNPAAKFIVISASYYQDHYDVAAHIVQVMWKLKIINAVILLPKTDNSVFYNVYSWLPYNEGKCGVEFSEVKIIDLCAFGNFSKGINWFPNRIPNDLKKCEVKVRTIIWPPFVNYPIRRIPNTNQYEFQTGIEIKIMNTIAKAANFTVNYTLSDRMQDWGGIGANNTSTGMMASLINEEVDIGMCSLSATILRHLSFESSLPYIEEALTFCVPQSDLKPYWMKVMAILSIEVLLSCFICIMLITIISVHLARNENAEANTYKEYTSNILNILCMLMSSPVFMLPKTGPVRFLIMTWVIFCLNLNTIYQTSLISVLSSRTYEQKLTTVEDLINSNLDIYILSTDKKFFREDSSTITKIVKSKSKECNDMEECLAEVAFKKDAAMLTPRTYYRYISNKYIADDGHALVFCFRENMVSYQIEMLMRKGFVLRNRINEILDRIISSGLIPMWTKETFREGFIEKSGVKKLSNAMTLSQILFVFYIYGIAMLVSVFVFIGELLVYKYYHKEIRNKYISKEEIK